MDGHAPSTERRFAEVRWLGAFFLDMLGGLATLKMFGRSREQVDTIRTISRQYGDTTMEVLRTAFQTSLVLEWGGAVAVALVAVEISLRLMDGAIAFDRALAVLIIVPEFFLPLRQLAGRYHSGAAGRAVAVRAFAILDEPLPASHRGGVGSGESVGVPAGGQDGGSPGLAITFRDVSYTYPGRIEPAVRGLDLEIPAGRLTALVGVSGAGKSTIASLLLRFVEPDSGRILVGDTGLALIGLGDWRAQVAWVPQLPHLFHGSVADNIRLARPGTTDAAVRAAAREAGADDFIAALPHGYEQAVGERGVRLSGGQRQRIAIARAILADARLVILDEATSQLDAASETVIRETIRRLAGARTVLVVSHRLRLASVADAVAVIDAGRVTETGRPSDLAQRDGAYRRLLDVRQADPRRGGAVTTFRRLFGLLAGHRRWIVGRRVARVPGCRLERGADGDVGLPHLEGRDREQRGRDRAGHHRGPGAGHRPGRLPLSRAVRDPSRDVRDPGRPAGLVLRLDRTARAGAPGDPSERRPAGPDRRRHRHARGLLRPDHRPARRGSPRDRPSPASCSASSTRSSGWPWSPSWS